MISGGKFPIGAPHTGRVNHDVIVPERVGIPAVRLPSEINTSDFGRAAAPLPLAGVVIRYAVLDGEGLNSGAIQPGLHGAVRAQMVLKALPGVGGEGGRSRDSLWGEVWQRGVVGLAVVHQDLALPSDADVLIRALRGVWHGDE